MKVAPSQDPDVRQIMSSFVRVVSDESLVLLSDSERRVWRYQRGNQNPFFFCSINMNFLNEYYILDFSNMILY
jgi:hypothetical protein